MSDLSVSSGSRDTQSRSEELKQDHERKIAKLREDFKTREDDIRNSGEAAVSHLRKQTDEQVQSARSESDAKLQKEEAGIRTDYGNIKRRAVQQNENLEQNIRAESENSDRKIKGIHTAESKTLEQSQEKIREFISNQEKLKERVEKQTGQDITNAERLENEKIQIAKRSGDEQVQKIGQEKERQAAVLKSENVAAYDQYKNQAQARLDELKRNDQTNYSRERTTAQHSIDDVRGKEQTAIQAEQQSGEKRLAVMQRENKSRFEQTRARDLKTNETTQAQYSGESQRIQVEGERDIQERQTKFRTLEKSQVQANAAEFKKTEELHMMKEQDAKKEHDAHLQETGKKLNQDLAQQRNQFKGRFEAEQETFKNSLDNQKEGYLRELYKQKVRIDKSAGLESARENDPFYRLHSFNANLSENDSSYFLKAKVAPYEKDSVVIHVKDDRVTLSARRAFEDDHKDANQRISTNSYQTYRQEFKLGAPADALKMVKTIAEDGTISVIIPKKVFIKPEDSSAEV
jgi:HSP20 family molecular chaperone IbpA